MLIDKIKTFTFGKVAHYSARKVNLAEITLETRTGERWAGNVSICGGIWNATKTDYVECGQCLDTIYKYRSEFPKEKREMLDCLYGLWKRCHLKYWNDISDADKRLILELLGKEG